ncbi:MAG: bifunctional biotin--[acetyl-CoA-carboxylase] ligase/biotin operon repressor BirA [Congregibacter sp.]
MQNLLTILADGEIHSGQDLADKQGVSRTAVWKQVRAVADLGVDVERVRGLGYRVPGGLDLLDQRLIERGLQHDARALLAGLEIYTSIDSTNLELQRRNIEASGATVCLAESQTAGRGRRGRAWQSPFASSIYMSVAWKFHGGATAFGGLSLMLGVVVSQALDALGVDGVGLKWPNDVLRHGRKLAGVLVEISGDVTGPCTVIMGIGINVAVPKEAARQIDQPWSDLSELRTAGTSRNQIVAQVLNRLLPALAVYEEQGFANWSEPWHALHVYQDQPVLIRSAEQVTTGIARGVDEQGALLLETPQGVQRMHGGEVSLRPVS